MRHYRLLAQLGIEGIRVDRSTGDLLRDFYGVEPGRKNLAEIARIASTDPARVIAADPQLEADPLDKSTPRTMLNLMLVFTRGSDTPLVDRERAVAEVARTLYDYRLIHPANT